MAQCMLSLANGKPDVLCDQGSCLYWRALDHLGVARGDGEGCAIQHFALLDDGHEMAAWLISVKERVAADALGQAVDEALDDEQTSAQPPAGCALVEGQGPR